MGIIGVNASGVKQRETRSPIYLGLDSGTKKVFRLGQLEIRQKFWFDDFCQNLISLQIILTFFSIFYLDDFQGGASVVFLQMTCQTSLFSWCAYPGKYFQTLLITTVCIFCQFHTNIRDRYHFYSLICRDAPLRTQHLRGLVGIERIRTKHLTGIKPTTIRSCYHYNSKYIYSWP